MCYRPCSTVLTGRRRWCRTMASTVQAARARRSRVCRCSCCARCRRSVRRNRVLLLTTVCCSTLSPRRARQATTPPPPRLARRTAPRAQATQMPPARWIAVRSLWRPTVRRAICLEQTGRCHPCCVRRATTCQRYRAGRVVAARWRRRTVFFTASLLSCCNNRQPRCTYLVSPLACTSGCRRALLPSSCWLRAFLASSTSCLGSCSARKRRPSRSYRCSLTCLRSCSSSTLRCSLPCRPSWCTGKTAQHARSSSLTASGRTSSTPLFLCSASCSPSTRMLHLTAEGGRCKTLACFLPT
mmetsp:Transcript_4572/g.10356  ORF Transcript_4572/g.10356 Transcript_4572/m.10356 type:complete len:298 (-) Transcript_4572:761-1654(-)